MSVKEKYKVLMGGAEAATTEVTVGFLEKGNATPKGKHVKQPFKKGNCIFPNRTEAWGRRLMKGEVPKTKQGQNGRVEPNNLDYTGEVEWMPYGTEGGYMIIARYKNGCSTLDYQYQLRVGYPAYEKDEEHNYVEFPSGLNEFEYEIDPVLIEFLKIHHGNRDSKSKNPNSELDMYREVRVFDTKEQEVKEIDSEFDAVSIVKSANSFEKLDVLKMILSGVEVISYNPSKESSLYDNLVLFAKQRSVEFLSAINGYKKNVSELVELCKSFEVFDLTTDNTVVILKPKKEVLIEEVKVKGEDIPQWMFDNCLEPVVYKALEKLMTYSKKFKS